MIRQVQQLKKIKISNLGIAIVLNLFFFLLAITFCDIKYEVSDDFIIAAVLAGTFGESQNPLCMYINPVLAYLLLPFYKFVPMLNWYLIMQLGLSLISFTGITYMLFEKLDRKYAFLLSILFIVFFTNDAYILIQFTKTAMIVGMSGAVLFAWSLFQYRSKIFTILSGTLCVLGSMIRFSIIYVLGTFILVILFDELKKIYKEQKKFSFVLKKFLLPGILLIGITFGFQNFYEYIYMNTEGYREFYEYNSARASVVDRSDYGYEMYREELERQNISENDYLAARTWNFSDPDYFSLEKMENIGKVIAEFKNNLEIDWKDIIVKIQDRQIQTYEIFLGCVILFLISVVFQKNFLRYIMVFLVIGIAYEIYFFGRERVVYRVEYGVFFCVFVSLLYVWNLENERILNNSIEICRICVIIISMCCLYKIPLYLPDLSYKGMSSLERKNYIDSVFWDSASYDSRKYRKVVNKEKPQSLLLKEFEQNKENFYFLDFQTTIQTLYFEWNPWKNLPSGYFDNFMYFGGITTNFPDVTYMLKKNKVENPMLSLMEDNVYLVDNAMLMIKLNYIREHYYPNAEAELYKEIDGYQIWKLYKQ